MSTRGPVLVTGASGFLGSHLVHHLLGEGREVHAYARPESAFARLKAVATRVTRWDGEIDDDEAIGRACRESRATVVLHCAGETSARNFAGDWTAVDRAMTVNLRGTLALLQGAVSPGSHVTQVIRIGGLEEYGTAPTPWREAMREQPSSPYSASQVAATHACQALQPHLPFGVITLRPALTYGPDQSTDFLIPALITSLLARKRFAMTDGQQFRDLLYVSDFVSAVACTMRHVELRGAVINISAAHEWKVADIAGRIAVLLGAEALLDIGAHPVRAGELQHLVAENDLAAELLGWHPEVWIDEGLERTVEWYRKGQKVEPLQ